MDFEDENEKEDEDERGAIFMNFARQTGLLPPLSTCPKDELSRPAAT
jgi:hypothetical protein